MLRLQTDPKPEMKKWNMKDKINNSAHLEN